MKADLTSVMQYLVLRKKYLNIRLNGSAHDRDKHNRIKGSIEEADAMMCQFNHGTVKTTDGCVRVVFTTDDVDKIAHDVMNLGLQLRQDQINGFDGRSGNDVVSQYLDSFMKNV